MAIGCPGIFQRPIRTCKLSSLCACSLHALNSSSSSSNKGFSFSPSPKSGPIKKNRFEKHPAVSLPEWKVQCKYHRLYYKPPNSTQKYNQELKGVYSSHLIFSKSDANLQKYIERGKKEL